MHRLILASCSFRLQSSKVAGTIGYTCAYMMYSESGYAPSIGISCTYLHIFSAGVVNHQSDA